MNDKIEWVLVPREATTAMLLAALRPDGGGVMLLRDATKLRKEYAAMLAAAPKPEAQAAGVLSGLRRYYFDGEGVDETAEFVRLDEAEAALSTPASHDAQQPPAFQRWSMTKGSDGARWSVYMDHDPCGEWVKWIEVQQHCFGMALAQQPAVVGDAEVSRYWRDRAQRAEALSFSMSPGPGPQKGCRLDAAGNPMREVSPGVWQSALAWPDAALTPAATPGEPEEYEFEVFQGGAWQAGGSAPDFATAQAEANHYAMMYGQDGPEVEVKFYARREVSPAQKEGNGNV